MDQRKAKIIWFWIMTGKEVEIIVSDLA